jgi:phosphoribosylamine--glycine ligase
MCFCDGEHLVPMPIVQDHKRLFVGDQGPNTGGMGCYSDVNHHLPFLTLTDVESALTINEAVIKALHAEFNDKYIGILYGSFIATANGVAVIEFNARFGDPEALSVLTILESDFVAICAAMVTGNLLAEQVKFSPRATVCKYAVPVGYPDLSVKPAPIDLSAVKNKSQLFLASVHAVDGQIMAMGSRTAAYVGVADSIFAAEEIAEKEICAVNGPLFHREDIGTERLIQCYVDNMRKLRDL